MIISKEEKWSRRYAKKVQSMMSFPFLKDCNLIAVAHKVPGSTEVIGEDKINYDFGMILYFRNK